MGEGIWRTLWWAADDVYWIAAILCLLGALWRGGATERFASALPFIWLAFHRAWEPDAEIVGELARQQWNLAIDAGNLVAVALLVTRSDRAWLLWMAAFQLLSVLTRAAVLLDGSVSAVVAVTAVNTWNMLQMAAIATAVWTCVRRRPAVRAPSASGYPATGS